MQCRYPVPTADGSDPKQPPETYKPLYIMVDSPYPVAGFLPSTSINIHQHPSTLSLQTQCLDLCDRPHNQYLCKLQLLFLVTTWHCLDGVVDCIGKKQVIVWLCKLVAQSALEFRMASGGRWKLYNFMFERSELNANSRKPTNKNKRLSKGTTKALDIPRLYGVYYSMIIKLLPKKTKKQDLVGGWTNPFKKNMRKSNFGSSSPQSFRVKIKNIMWNHQPEIHDHQTVANKKNS